MKQLMGILTIAIATMIATGCASIGTRAVGALGETATGHDSTVTPYPGVITDVLCIFTSPLGAPFFAADLPLSAVADTVLLPHDIAQMTKPQ